MRAVTANISAANPQAFVRLDNWWGAALAVQIVVSGAAVWKLSHSFDDPNDLVSPIPVGSMFWDQSLLPLAGQGGSGNLTFNLPVSPLWMQFALTSGAGPARATFVQLGVHSRSNIVKSMPWSPAKLPNLVAWYDGQDAATITLNAGNVSQWNDKSGSGYNVTQGTAANQPGYNAAALSGKPGLTFNGSSQFIVAALPAGRFPSAFGWYGVLQTPAAANGLAPVVRGLANLPAPCYVIAPSVYIGNGTVYTLASTVGYGALPTTPVVFGCTYVPGTDFYTDWTNGTQSGLITVSASADYGDTATTLNIGTRPDQGIYFSGTIGEIVTVNALATPDRQKLEGYLAWKWGLQGSLPTGHPYKSGPP